MVSFAHMVLCSVLLYANFFSWVISLSTKFYTACDGKWKVFVKAFLFFIFFASLNKYGKKEVLTG